MQFDFSALEKMTAAVEGRGSLAEALAHPAYRAVFEHARRYGSGLMVEDVSAALRGAPSPFYGLKGLTQNLAKIQQLADRLRQNQSDWVAAADRELERVLPDEELDSIIVYPILGYDKGIGLGDAVCMNLNCPAYLELPDEFLYYMIHEAAHVLFERRHKLPALAAIKTAADWAAYFSLWTQNEGFAVYAALNIRQRNRHLQDEDYQALSDPLRLQTSLRAFEEIRSRFESGEQLPEDQYLESTFGDQRVTYRAGCQIFRNIERQIGLAGVRQAFLADSASFLKHYGDYAALF
jgi:hypothetical protein